MSIEESRTRGKGYSSLTGRYFDRRIVLKAAAGLGALAAAGGVSTTLPTSAIAQEAVTTQATRFIPEEAGGDFSAAATTDWLTFTADYTFTALGASWSPANGESPQIELQLSTGDGVWSDSYRLTAQVEDGGRENRSGRIFTWLLLTAGAVDVRYRTQDGSGNAASIDDLSIVYLDSSGGPTEAELDGFSAAAEDTSIVSPRIVNRTQWGANESYLNWSPEYETVSHIIIHHTATSNNISEWAGAVRNIYYYHAVEQGWGDIGYNYLVSPTGTIYEGRFGGQNVIGGHAYQYAVGSSGIGLLGDYTSRNVPTAALSALAAITAFVARDLDPLGFADFLEAPDLPIISSHRDVSSTSCPGDRLWTSLPNLRTLVAETLNDGDLETGNPGGIVIGDRITVTTDDDGPLNVRSSANGSVAGSVANSTMGWVIEGPTILTGGNWYRVEFPTITGWVSATFLTVTPPPPPASDETFFFGVNITINAETFVRRLPTMSSSNLGTAPSGTNGFVLDGPATGDGMEWYQIAFPNDVVSDGWVTKQVLTVSVVDDNPDAQFVVPSNAIVTERLNVRVRPGIAQTIQGTAAVGSKIKLTVDPVGIDGYIFYGAYGSFGGGWVVEDFIRADTTGPVTGKFALGDAIRSNASVNLRSSASTSGAIIRTLSAGVNATVTGGPSSSSGYIWYLLRLSTGETGWSAQDFWDETTPPTEPPPNTGKFEIGDSVRVTESLRLRTSASTSAGIITTLSPGTTGTVQAGPTSANGYTWWQIQTSAGTGWAADEWLVESGGTPPPTEPPPTTGKFEIGDSVRVTESLRLRTSASTSGGIITTLSPGTTGTVLAGPTSANGYTWWRIQTSAGTGWAADEWLVEGSGTTPPPPADGIAVGDTVRVFNGNLNLRTSASTSATVIRVLQEGTQLTVTGGPSTGSGYTWYQVSNSSLGSGWVASDFIQEA